jgi:signal peptidase I
MSSERPDVRVDELIPFEAPHVRLDQITTFDTQYVRPRSKTWELFESLASTIVFVLLFTTLVAQATKVPTESMVPTIMVGDHFFLDKVAFPGNFPASIRPWLPRREIQRGDIIAFRAPVDPKTPFVKRVIAIGGDTIEGRGKIVLVNGVPLDEPYKIHTDSFVYSPDASGHDTAVRDNFGPITVEEGHYFVMGDNRDNSNDSRYWGTVEEDSVIGKPLFVYWSYESGPYVQDLNWRERGKEYLSIAMHFFTRTRWFRMGTMVD